VSKKKYGQYQKTSVQSASREKLLLMLYEGAIKYMKRAKAAIQKNDIKTRGENVGYAYDIVCELNNTLDHSVGGDIALNLEKLYMFVNDKLVEANINNKEKPLDEAIKVFEILYEGWNEAIDKLKAEGKQKTG